MTGIFVRVKRGQWIDEEIEHLSNEELREFLATKDENWKDNLINSLCAIIAKGERKIEEMGKTIRTAYSELKEGR